MSIFKSYDIRGIYPNEINETIAYKIAKAYSTIINKNNPKIVVGYDMRLSSKSLHQAIIDSLILLDADVIDLGLINTPSFYFAVSNYNYDGGIMVTASHNPKEWNGFKLVKEKAIPISYETGLKDMEKLSSSDFEFEISSKQGKYFFNDFVLYHQIKRDLSYINLKKIKPLKVISDTANSIGIQYINELFKYLPCEIIKINEILDGTFPSHEADPLKKENLEQLMNKVIECKADLGIATDGDGDRLFFVDNNGEIINPAITRGLLSKLILKDYPNSKICYDIRPGKITKEMILENIGIPILTKVGHSLIKEKMREENAIFGAESSGHFFMKFDDSYYESPTIMILKILEYISIENKPISELIKPYKKYFDSGEINFNITHKDEKIIEIHNFYKDKAIEINTIDGLTIDCRDFWFNIRKSNTELKLRLNLEAISQSIVEEKINEISNILKK